MYRDINSIPVLAKAGGILPLTEEISASEAGKNPDSLKIAVYAGADGEFTLYEDDNISSDYTSGVCAKTRMVYQEMRFKDGTGKGQFVMEPARGDLSLIPAQREITAELTGFLPEAADAVEVKLDGTAIAQDCRSISYNKEKQAVVVWIEAVKTEERLEISIPLNLRSEENAVKERVFAFLNQAEISFELKDEIYALVQKERRIPVLLTQLRAMELENPLFEVLSELLTGIMG